MPPIPSRIPANLTSSYNIVFDKETFLCGFCFFAVPDVRVGLYLCVAHLACTVNPKVEIFLLLYHFVHRDEVSFMWHVCLANMLPVVYSDDIWIIAKVKITENSSSAK